MPIENCNVPALGLAFALGLLLSVGWLALYLLSWGWARTWAWIDDSEAPKNNPLLQMIMFRTGWKASTNRWSSCAYEKGNESSSGAEAFFFPLVILFLGPMLAVIAFKLYPVTLAALTLYLIARLARFARRHKKLFDKHIKDPDAHKA